MTCPRETVIIDYVQLNLAHDASAAVDRHIDTCQVCRQLVAGLALLANPAIAAAPADDLAATLAAVPALDPARYEVQRELVRGGMGRISLAIDRVLGRAVALKEPLATSPSIVIRFQRELALTARLQHPAIVSLYDGGRWPDGALVYVMRFVAGESPDKVIARHATLDERLGLLPRVMAAAEGLAYAHAQGVLHRDLKPANVLVGEFGETVVIDWGLAKDLRAPDADGSDAALIAAPGETAVGTVIGTPVYMPPEQALGRPVDARADVYALGALLYHVLAGQPPYPPSDTKETLARVIAAPPPPLATRVPGTPRDLVAIVAKAMAREPGARYVDASGFAADLGRFLRGQLVGAHRYSPWQLARRFVRRHRAAVLTTALALASIAAIGVTSVRRVVAEEAAAQVARRDAEARTAAMRGLLDFMMGDLAEKLRPLGKMSLLESVATQAIETYGAEVHLGSSGHSDALRVLGDVRLEQGKLVEARALYVQALALDAEARTAAPDDRRALHDLADDHAYLGSSRRWPDAQAHNDLAWSHERLASLHYRGGDLKAALAAYQRAASVLAGLVAAYPDDVANRRSYARLRVNMSRVLAASPEAGGPAAALVECRAALDEFRALAAAVPGGGAYRRDMLLAGQCVGANLIDTGKLDDALVVLRDTLRVARELLSDDPNSLEFVGDVAFIASVIGEVLFQQHDLKGALAEYRTAVAAQERLAAQEGSASTFYNLHATHLMLGTVHLASGDAKAAIAEYHTALDFADRAVAAAPDRPRYRRERAALRVALAKELLALGQRTEAQTQLTTAHAEATALGPDDDDARAVATEAKSLLSRVP